MALNEAFLQNIDIEKSQGLCHDDRPLQRYLKFVIRSMVSRIAMLQFYNQLLAHLALPLDE